MALNTAFDCGTLPTWNTAECCSGCHVGTNDVRPTRVHWPQGYPVGATALLLAADSTKVLCCRAQLHAHAAMAGIAMLLTDSLSVAPLPVAPGTYAEPATSTQTALVEPAYDYTPGA